MARAPSLSVEVISGWGIGVTSMSGMSRVLVAAMCGNCAACTGGGFMSGEDANVHFSTTHAL